MFNINPNLLQKFRKKAAKVVNENIKLELSDPMPIDYYKGYRAGLIDSACLVTGESIDLLYEVLEYINNENLQNKVSKFLRGE